MGMTEVQDSNCVRGCLKSLLIDAGCNSSDIDGLLSKLNTQGNITRDTPDEVANLLQYIFSKRKVYTLKNIQEIRCLPIFIDNVSSFALLFWEGNNNGQNRHCTRYASHTANSIKLMDPQTGKTKGFTFDFLDNLSPKGFTLLYLRR